MYVSSTDKIPWRNRKWKCQSLLLALSLCDPKNYSPPGSSVHGISQARILVCIAMPFSKESSQPRDQTQVSYTEGRFFTIWATNEQKRKQWIFTEIMERNLEVGICYTRQCWVYDLPRRRNVMIQRKWHYFGIQ